MRVKMTSCSSPAAICVWGSPADADGVLTGPTEALLRLLGGRLDQAHPPDTVTLTSDVLTLDQLRRVFSGV